MTLDELIIQFMKMRLDHPELGVRHVSYWDGSQDDAQYWQIDKVRLLSDGTPVIETHWAPEMRALIASIVEQYPNAIVLKDVREETGVEHVYDVESDHSRLDYRIDHDEKVVWSIRADGKLGWQKSSMSYAVGLEYLEKWKAEGKKIERIDIIE